MLFLFSTHLFRSLSCFILLHLSSCLPFISFFLSSINFPFPLLLALVSSIGVQRQCWHVANKLKPQSPYLVRLSKGRKALKICSHMFLHILQHIFWVYFLLKRSPSKCKASGFTKPGCPLMQILASRILCFGNNRQVHMDCRNPVEKKGLRGCSLSQREGPRETATPPPSAFSGFHCFSRYITSRMVMHRFVLGGYVLQTTKERMLINTSKKDICKCKGKSGQTSYTPYLLAGLAQILGS